MLLYKLLPYFYCSESVEFSMFLVVSNSQ